MPYEAKVFSILIASPSDVFEEREIAVRTIQEWNDLHSSNRQIVLLPMRWETHTSPEYGTRPQEVINRQIVDQADLLIGIFWTRLGSSTGVKDSGTLEEIERVATSSKPVMLYFSKKTKDPDDIDTDQLIKLREFKKKTYPNSLIETFNNQIEFKDKLSRQIEMQVRKMLTNGGNSSGKIATDILLEFLDLKNGGRCGVALNIDTVYIDIIDSNDIPDYSSDDNIREEFDEAEGGYITIDESNKNYYRELIDFNVKSKLFAPIYFWLANQGTLGARDIYVVITIKSENNDFEIISNSGFKKDPPNKTHTRFFNRFMFNKSQDDLLDIKKINQGEWVVSFDLNALQPKREIPLGDPFFIGTNKSCNINLEAKIFADTLAEPIVHNLDINLNVKHEKISYKKLIKDD